MGVIKGVHVPHVEWVLPFYPVVLEVLPSHPSQTSKKNFFFDEIGHLHFLLDEMGLDKMGLDKMGLDKMGLDKMGLDKMGLDKMGLDEMGLDKTGLDEMGLDEMR